MDFLQVFLSQLKEALPICLRISVSMCGIYFLIRLLKNMFCYRGYSAFSNPFEDIFENIQDIKQKKSIENKSLYYDIEKNKSFYYEIEEIITPDMDKPYKINLSKDKSGG